MNKRFKERIAQKGGNKSEIARKLGGVSSQLLGHYERGRHKPKEDFFEKWQRVYKEDIRNVFKTNVSQETVSARNTDPLAEKNIQSLEDQVSLLKLLKGLRDLIIATEAKVLTNQSAIRDLLVKQKIGTIDEIEDRLSTDNLQNFERLKAELGNP